MTETTRFPIHELLRERFSPLAFSGRRVSDAELGSLLEAARWAPSCYNEQPWRFLVARRDDEEGFERLAGCLVDANRAWADAAQVLILAVARRNFRRNGKPNPWAWHDVGLASAHLIVQAQAMGLSVHEMAGFDADRARAELGVPADHDPVAVLAIGAAGDSDSLPEALRQRAAAPRRRDSLSEISAGAGWDRPLAPLGG